MRMQGGAVIAGLHQQVAPKIIGVSGNMNGEYCQ
jgi:hypothetical protein